MLSEEPLEIRQLHTGWPADQARTVLIKEAHCFEFVHDMKIKYKTNEKYSFSVVHPQSILVLFKRISFSLHIVIGDEHACHFFH